MRDERRKRRRAGRRERRRDAPVPREVHGGDLAEIGRLVIVHREAVRRLYQRRRCVEHRARVPNAALLHERVGEPVQGVKAARRRTEVV